MSLRRYMMMSFGGLAAVDFPTLHGTVDVWLDPGDYASLTISSGKVSTIANKAGDTSKNYTQALSGNQGFYTAEALNGRPAITNFVGYVSGTTSSYVYMHDRSTAYGIFDVYAINTVVASDVINNTTNGGNTNGTFIFPFGTYGMRKTIRQANADFTSSTDVIGAITGNNKWTLGTFFGLSDVYYGYQVTGDDYAMMFNGDTPAVTQAQSTTSTHASAPHNFAMRMGLNGGNHSFAEKIIIKWPTQTRAQIDEDIAAIRAYFSTKFNLW